jgi:hypothetical protein
MQGHDGVASYSLARRSRRRVDRGTLQGESAIVPGFALLSLIRAQRDTNGRVCSDELWVERLTNDDGFEGCQQRRPLLFGRLLVRSRRTERSMALSAKRWAYSLRPIDDSHSAIPFMAFPVGPRVAAARAASGHAAAAAAEKLDELAPFIQSPRRRGRAASAGFRGRAPWRS